MLLALSLYDNTMHFKFDEIELLDIISFPPKEKQTPPTNKN